MTKLKTKYIMPRDSIKKMCDTFGFTIDDKIFTGICMVYEDKDDNEKGNVVAIIMFSLDGAIIYRHNNHYSAHEILKDVPTIFDRYKLYNCWLDANQEVDKLYDEIDDTLYDERE